KPTRSTPTLRCRSSPPLRLLPAPTIRRPFRSHEGGHVLDCSGRTRLRRKGRPEAAGLRHVRVEEGRRWQLHLLPEGRLIAACRLLEPAPELEKPGLGRAFLRFGSRQGPSRSRINAARSSTLVFGRMTVS